MMNIQQAINTLRGWLAGASGLPGIKGGAPPSAAALRARGAQGILARIRSAACRQARGICK